MSTHSQVKYKILNTGNREIYRSYYQLKVHFRKKKNLYVPFSCNIIPDYKSYMQAYS